jgi:hypothetical protein
VPEVGLEPTRRLDPRGILSPVRLPIPPLRHQRFATRLTFGLLCHLFSAVKRQLPPTRTLPYGETHPVSSGRTQNLRLLGKLASRLPRGGRAGSPLCPLTQWPPLRASPKMRIRALRMSPPRLESRGTCLGHRSQDHKPDFAD